MVSFIRRFCLYPQFQQLPTHCSHLLIPVTILLSDAIAHVDYAKYLADKAASDEAKKKSIIAEGQEGQEQQQEQDEPAEAEEGEEEPLIAPPRYATPSQAAEQVFMGIFLAKTGGREITDDLNQMSG